ncbi:18S rRNA maturation protein [Naganishia albida]|nr:18S rRNA maturation protein [Naganishia albida]
MSTRPQKASTSDGGNKKHRPAPYNKNVKPKGGSGGAGGQSNASGLPGVSKIKSQIRQTTRLLSKDNLAPALRVQTERRLTSLQADLTKAEHRTVERKNGERYHMVKFFERKKILRIIKRIQRQLKELEGADGGKGKEKDNAQSTREELEKELEDARVMLNYVIHYPNTLKYVSLFPAATTNGKSKADEESEEQQAKLVLPPLLSQSAIDAVNASASASPKNEKHKQKSANAKVDKRRLDMLVKIRDLMRDLAHGKAAGDVAVSLEPENEKEDDRRKKISFDDVLGIKTSAKAPPVIASVEPVSKAEEVQTPEAADDFFE